MPSYKLYYFNARGRAEIARLMFAAAGVKYEDKRLQGEEWAKLKPQTPFGQMPVLEVDGRMFGQSVAIYCHLARAFGMYGKNDLEAFEVDQVGQIVVDLMNELIKFMFEKDEAKKAELEKTFGEVSLPKFMGFFKKLLSANGSGFFVGSGLTLADIAVFDTMWSLENKKEGTLAKFPEIKAFVDKISNIPNIKKYMASRPQSSF